MAGAGHLEIARSVPDFGVNMNSKIRGYRAQGPSRILHGWSHPAWPSLFLRSPGDSHFTVGPGADTYAEHDNGSRYPSAV